MNRTLVMMLAVIAAALFGCSSRTPDSTFQEVAGNVPGTQTEQTITTPPDSVPAAAEVKPSSVAFSNKPVELTTAAFKEKVFDMDKNPTQWVYKGGLPAIVDFYAVWCGPCKMAAPALEELAREYAGKVHIFKVDAEKERYLSSYFQVSGYPTFMVIPASGQPRIFTGLPQGVRTQADIKPAFKQIIENELL
ncbi:MAG TPA: thioredoxin domain-containing protein [Bacteroidales bacterium]|nr:thioredoxin domain-containing protein [Bacteroidales bacterium]HRZ48121.1 thioredoxin domain-containing protein [Bacteroidales bacterium]